MLSTVEWLHSGTVGQQHAIRNEDEHIKIQINHLSKMLNERSQTPNSKYPV